MGKNEEIKNGTENGTENEQGGEQKEKLLGKLKKPFKKAADYLDNVSVLDVLKAGGKAVAAVGALAGAVAVGMAIKDNQTTAALPDSQSENGGSLPGGDDAAPPIDVPFTEVNEPVNSENI